jgi:uncharacterized protein YgbK (DUF1537 family)
MRLRLIADDLTGALDTAAQFVGSTGPVPVFWAGRLPEQLPPSAVIDSGTREQDDAAAAATARDLAGILAPQPGAIAYRKLDSLLRGHSGRELAAGLCAAPVRHCIVAPAFPFQGRVTRGGLQYRRMADGWQRVGEDLCETLVQQGLDVHRTRPGDAVPEGISLWDADTDEDLRRIAETGAALGTSVLWCGSSGLAGALAAMQKPISRGARQPVAGPIVGSITGPILGFFGSDHSVTAAQLDACGSYVLRLPDGCARNAERVARHLAEVGVALIGFDLPTGLSRAEAARRIDRDMDALSRHIARPRSLIVAGGETLRGLCQSLGADRLDVTEQIIPGVPRAIMRGGRWDGIDIVSKSGAFGEASLLQQLVAAAAPSPGG